ncbi:MAG TPA: ABC transporter substrate-binding protein [Actinomycetota bacterium]|nr:ABC transporter substrate-binding protein [Actinomycetota bacterium]
MKRYLQVIAIVSVLAVVAVACKSSSSTTSSGGGATPQKGGTLKTVMTQDFFHGLDPTAEYYSVSWEFLRCCMARTLLNYLGTPVDQGGADLQPDLAESMPTVSSDGLTWDFTLRPNIMYGDPLNKPITAHDFVNSFNRLEDPAVNSTGYPFYYTSIKGFKYPLPSGQKPDVTGVIAKDDTHLEIQLTKPDQDLPYLVAMSATAPLPDELIKDHYPATELGQFLVSSGPYEWEGMKGINLAGKTPPKGMDIGRSYVFVRNPSWDPSSDPIRGSKAFPDEIDIQVGGEVQDLLDKVAAGAVDWCIDCSATSTTLQKYAADPTLASRLRIYPGDVLYYTGLNVFQPPFDDVHVRTALNWALDKNAMWVLAGGQASGTIAGHFIPPGMLGKATEDGQPPSTYNPYATDGDKGDVTKAQDEMKQSKYDTNGDGKCDGPDCTIDALTVTNDNDALKALNIMSQSFAPIGIKLNIKQLSYNALVTKCATLASHTAFCQAGWGKDFSDPYTFFYPLLDGGENGSNYSFMGTTTQALQKAGYTNIPSPLPAITDDITKCHGMPLGDEANQCWADLDVKVMTQIVPLIPRRFGTNIDVLGERIVNYSYDQFAGVGDPSQMSLANGGAS